VGKTSARWGFKIDYDAAIKDDEFKVAGLERIIELGLYCPEEWKSAGGGTLFFLVLHSAEAAAKLGLTLEDRVALAVESDRLGDYPELAAAYPQDAIFADWYRRGDAVAKSLAWHPWSSLLASEEAAKTLLKKCKASLSRHKRNKAKFGGK
jgi:hypothetical protein